jgi:hypothetical protein
MAKQPPNMQSPFGTPIIGGGGKPELDERIFMNIISGINSNMGNAMQALAAINVRLDELNGIARLQTMILAQDKPMPVDIGRFVRISGRVMHPHLWGLLFKDDDEEPSEDKYLKVVGEWSEITGVKLNLTGDFAVQEFDEMKKNIEKAAKKQAEEDEVDAADAKEDGYVDTTESTD